jgi:uncharacterized protein (DUF885 family)
MAKKRNWKFWTSRTILLLLLIGVFWVCNLIWFKPFNIKHFYDKVFVEFAIDSPELTTAMGIPVLYDRSKDELDDISDAKNWENFNKMKENYETLMSYDFDNQSKKNKLNTKILAFYIKGEMDSEPFFYHGYPVNQMGGVQNSLPSLMESAHKLEDKSDVEAYISRLSKFDTKFEQLKESLEISESKGIIPPKFIIARVLNEMNGFIGTNDVLTNKELSNTIVSSVKSNILYTNFEMKIDEIEDLTQDQKDSFKQQVEDEISTTVFGAYQSLINYFESLYDKATTDAGVWKLPDGNA